MKEQYLEFIKEFSKINITKICKELQLNRSNILNGNSSEEKTRVLYSEIKKQIQNLPQIEEMR